MVPYLYTARDQHLVQNEAQYLAKHRAHLAKWQRAGGRQAVHDSPVRLVARVMANQWIVDCECGAGNAVDPRWPVACCFGCGALHRDLVWPEDVLAIERALLERPRPGDRHWQPGETVEQLIAENLAAGLRGAA